MEARFNIQCMEKCGIEVKELRCIGGGAKSGIWLQLKADITGKKVTALEVPEAGCLGAAILAGIGCGVFRNAGEAVSKYVKVKDIYLPDPNASEAYSKIYSRYLDIYPISKVLFS